jgi:multimeric flavodoxin WrbA
MKIVAINGSPRKGWNTCTLLSKVLEGAASQNAETELINLYDLQYKGCISCFSCKIIDGVRACAMKDGLTPLLEMLRTADAIVFGSPIYFMGVTSGMAAFLERFLYPYSIYRMETPTVFPRRIPSVFLYTMNVKKAQTDMLGVLHASLKPYEIFTEIILGVKPEILYSYNTYQYSDYSKYEHSIFSVFEKSNYRKEQFPIDCEEAFQTDVKLVKHL